MLERCLPCTTPPPPQRRTWTAPWARIGRWWRGTWSSTRCGQTWVRGWCGGGARWWCGWCGVVVQGWGGVTVRGWRLQRGDACVWPGREGLFRSKGHRCSADADGRCLSALPAPQACWASPPRTCSTASSPSSSPSSTSGSETTPRCGAVQGGVGWVVMLGGSGLGEMHGVTPGSAAARSWAAPLRTSTSTHSRLHSPHSCPLPAAAHRPPPTASCPAERGGGTFHHQLQWCPVPRVPGALAGYAAAGQRRVRVRGRSAGGMLCGALCGHTACRQRRRRRRRGDDCHAPRCGVSRCPTQLHSTQCCNPR